MKRDYPVKVYVNFETGSAVVFPLFGKYYRLHTDGNILDFATDFIVSEHSGNTCSYAGYLSCFEDTAVIELDKIAA